MKLVENKVFMIALVALWAIVAAYLMLQGGKIMAVIKLQTNVPVEVRLRSIEGKPVESQFGGMQHMFATVDGNSFYVSEAVGQILTDQCRKLNIRPGEPIDIVKAEVSKGGGRKGIQWSVSKVGFVVGEQKNGTLVVQTPQPPSQLEQQLAASIQMVEARKAAQIAQEAQPKWAQALSSQTKQLVDVYADLVNYASAKHGNAVRSDDIRAMMTTVFINLSKQGGNSNAA
jgi:hypothetical protein